MTLSFLPQVLFDWTVNVEKDRHRAIREATAGTSYSSWLAAETESGSERQKEAERGRKRQRTDFRASPPDKAPSPPVHQTEAGTEIDREGISKSTGVSPVRPGWNQRQGDREGYTQRDRETETETERERDRESARGGALDIFEDDVQLSKHKVCSPSLPLSLSVSVVSVCVSVCVSVPVSSSLPPSLLASYGGFTSLFSLSLSLSLSLCLVFRYSGWKGVEAHRQHTTTFLLGSRETSCFRVCVCVGGGGGGGRGEGVCGGRRRQECGRESGRESGREREREREREGEREMEREEEGGREREACIWCIVRWHR